MYRISPLQSIKKAISQMKSDFAKTNKVNRRKFYFKLIKFISIVCLIMSVIITTIMYVHSRFNTECKLDLTDELTFLDPPSKEDEALIGFDFKAYENINYSSGYEPSGHDRYIVPNIVHLIKMRNNTVDFVDLICIRSIYLNQKPDKIIIHCDCDELTGKYWPYLKDIPNLVIRRFEPPELINGVKPAYVQHLSDVVRINALRRFGGIYLDTDVYVLKSLNTYRKYEMALCLPPTGYMGSQVLIAHRKSRFLAWYEASYKCYDPSKWYFNAGEFPTTEVINHLPWLVHGETWRFGCDMEMIPRLFGLKPFPTMMEYTAMHVFIRHRYYAAPPDPVTTFDENNIKNYTRPFGELARLVIFGQREMVPWTAPILSIHELEKRRQLKERS